MRRKDAEQARARQLRREGRSLGAIANELGVAKSSVSVWVRDVEPSPTPPPPLRVVPAPEPLPLSGEKRTCSRCHESLPIEAFNRMGAGRQAYCRECFRQYFRERGDLHRDQVRATAPARRRRAREFMVALLEGAQCADCAIADVLVLEFDHIGEKTAHVSTLLRSVNSLERLRAEIDECEVVCANCHRRRTATRAGWFRVTLQASPVWSPAQWRNNWFVLGVLRLSSCVDCGEDDPVVLEFDHRGNKRANVSHIVRWASLETLRSEIDKCDVRCANCHRRRTFTEAGSYRVARIESGGPP